MHGERDARVGLDGETHAASAAAPVRPGRCTTAVRPRSDAPRGWAGRRLAALCGGLRRDTCSTTGRFTPGDQDRDKPRRVDHRQRERNAVGRRHARPAADANQVGFIRPAKTRRPRRPCRSASSAADRGTATRCARRSPFQQHEVEPVAPSRASPAIRDLALIARSASGAARASDATVLGDPGGADGLADHLEVAPLVVLAHTPLVHHPDVRAGPREVPEHRVDHQARVQGEGCGAARERKMERPEHANAVERVHHHVRRERADRRLHVLAHDDRPGQSGRGGRGREFVGLVHQARYSGGRTVHVPVQNERTRGMGPRARGVARSRPRYGQPANHAARNAKMSGTSGVAPCPSKLASGAPANQSARNAKMSGTPMPPSWL